VPGVPPCPLALHRAERERGASAVVPVAGARGLPEPLCAWYAPDALAVCDALLAAGERRAAALLEALPRTRRLDAAALADLGVPARLLTSVDTLADLARIGGRLPDGEDTARR
jgi:molybdopterin-guanine dinucleotide biosynthesis protein A